jgi:hypothetical protein
LFFERLLARPVPAPGGVRAANRHARCAPQAIFARLAGNWDVLPKFTVNYGKLRQITVVLLQRKQPCERGAATLAS